MKRCSFGSGLLLVCCDELGVVVNASGWEIQLAVKEQE